MTQADLHFTVVIPSRNRPGLLEAAVHSVLAQTHPAFEIVIVNDGSDARHAADYTRIVGHSERIRLLDLEYTRNGHGPSYAINRGAELARGEYLCFLDDDDSWTDPEHLERAWQSLTASSQPVDLYLSNQKAFVGERPVEQPLWLESLAPAIRQQAPADSQGVHPVMLPQLMRLHGFPHLNNTLVRRALYEAVGGMDENIRYECEWDLYFRLADRAAGIRYYPGFVSRHNVPDKSKTTNASTVVGGLQKLLFRATVMDKALLFAQSPAIRQAAARIKASTCKHLAATLAANGRPSESYLYARQALGLEFGFKWLLYCGYLGLRALTHRLFSKTNPPARGTP